MKTCDICQGENPKKAKKCILCGNKFKKPIYKRGWFIFLMIICIWNVSSKINSFQREKALYNNSNVSVKGIFVLNDDWLLSDDNTMDLSNQLAENETYAFVVYDLMNFTSANLSLNGRISLTMNDENTYFTTNNGGNSEIYMTNFVEYSGYATVVPSRINGYSDPIRMLHIYKINKRDIHDNTTATINIQLTEPYAAKHDFETEDIISISYFDDIFQIEELPQEYQSARSVYIKLLHLKAALERSSMTVIGRMKALTVLQEDSISLVSTPMTTYSPSDTVVYKYDETGFDFYDVRKIYPEIGDLLVETIENADYDTVNPLDNNRSKQEYNEFIANIDTLIAYFEK